MKKSNIIILSIIYSIVLSFINLYSISASHEFYFIILPFLIDPITHFILYMGWFDNINLFFQLLIFIPIFWPLIVYLLIRVKHKKATYILLALYVFIIIISLYRLTNEPSMFVNTISSMAVYFEPAGIILFIAGQIGLFYILRLKKEGRLN